MSKNALIGRLNVLKKEFSEENLEKFFRKSFGSKSLSHLENLVRNIYLKIERAIDIGEEVSEPTLTQFTTQIDHVIQILKQAGNADDINYINNGQQFENQLIKINEEILKLWSEFRTIILEKDFSATERIKNLSQYEVKITELTEQLQNQQNKASEDTKIIHDLKNKLENEFNNFDSRIKETITKGEFLVQQDIFKKQAERHKKIANNWLYGIAMAIAILVFVTIYIFNNFCFETKCLGISQLTSYNTIYPNCGHQILIFELLKSILFRLFIVSTSLYLLIFCVRNYNAQMHNFTINSHKENAFAAALSLLSKAKTPEGNDKLMVEAAQSIFSHQKTGYGGKESEIQNLNMLTSLIDKFQTK